MRVLIDVNHPAHVHLFKNLSWELEKRGHEVFWAARPRDIIGILLNRYGFNYKMLTTAKPGYINMAKELIERDYKIYKLVKNFRPTIMLGTSVCIAHVSKVTNAKSVVFSENDANADRIFSTFSYPFADTICTPDCLKDNLGRKHMKYPSYQELAYLHPNRFKPNSGILKKLGVNESDKYFILRFVSFRASHDIGQSGISLSTCKKLIDKLSKHGKVFITSEVKLPPEFDRYEISIPPHEFHDALSYVTMCIGDSSTVVEEAAVLGAPAIYCSSLAGKFSILHELQYKYNLIYQFLPKDEDRMLHEVEKLLNKPNLREEWQGKRKRMLKDKIDLTEWMIDFVENYPKSFTEYKKKLK